jgi:hypothetical protein
MMLPKWKGFLAVCLAVGALTSPGYGSQFTAGDVVVFEAGNGSGDIEGDTAYACSLLEYNPTQVNQSSPVQTIPLPEYDSGTQHALTTAGQFTDHLMTLSANGQYLSVIGYDVAAGTSYNPGFGPEPAYDSPNRTIARIDALGNVDTSTAGPFGTAGTTTHGTASADGSGFWYSTAQPNASTPSIAYVPFGGSTPTILSSNYSAKTLSVFDGQLYACSSSTGTPGVSAIGTGLPTSGTQALSPLVGTNNSTINPSATGYFLATLKPGDTGPDVLYLCNYNGNGEITKYSLEGGTWVLNGEIAESFATDLTGTVSNGAVTLFTTSTNVSGSSSSAVLSTVVDTSGYGNPYSSTTLTTLVSIPITGDSIGFRGVAMAPSGSSTVTSSAWNSSASGNWSLAANWTGGVPDAVGASAMFNTLGSTTKTITVDAAQTVGAITFNSAAAYSIQGSYSLTLSNTSGSAAITVLLGSHTISEPLVITSGLSVTTAADPGASSPSLTLPLAINSTATIVKAGMGTLAFAASPSGISTLNLSSLLINQGTVRLDSGTTTDNRTLLVLGSLTINGGSLDLKTNDLDLQTGSLSLVTSKVAAGYLSSAGITSSAVLADSSQLTRLGVIQNSLDGTPTGTPLYGNGANTLGLFDGVNPPATDVLVKYTYVGDANLDGKIDGSDYSRIDDGYLNHLTGWYSGDFNYDGVVDGSDYTLIDNAFNTQGASLADQQASPGSAVDMTISTAASVPEPAAVLPVFVLGGLARIRSSRTRRCLKSSFNARHLHGIRT